MEKEEFSLDLFAGLFTGGSVYWRVLKVRFIAGEFRHEWRNRESPPRVFPLGYCLVTLSGVEFGNFHYATWSLFCHRVMKKRSIFEIMVYNPFFFNQTGFRSEYNKEKQFSSTPSFQKRAWSIHMQTCYRVGVEVTSLNDGSDLNQRGVWENNPF